MVYSACFKKINNDLENLITKYDQPHLVRWFYHKQKNSFLLKELKALKKQHLKISESVQMLNIIFSPQLLATIIFIIIIITFELYFNMIDWRNGLSISWIRQISHRNVMPYVVFYAVKIALIVWVCEAGKNQAIKISTIVHDLLNNTNDEQIKHELQLFSLQIMHRDNTFSAKCLSLDATLLTMVSKQSINICLNTLN
ncbi:PREDICTED: putative gustatory receptor 28b [Trachymyrmex septentrionalis]|uniref:putative gustatory receptor 28b n=1 Tax=Trachymyrmex septentrionalis TaxID=34720 RepID=UPI00084F3470|nr:PREDICTED: putative gustatory receptor 28b [Trachymyrmex septentrionalis]